MRQRETIARHQTTDAQPVPQQHPLRQLPPSRFIPDRDGIGDGMSLRSAGSWEGTQLGQRSPTDPFAPLAHTAFALPLRLPPSRPTDFIAFTLLIAPHPAAGEGASGCAGLGGRLGFNHDKPQPSPSPCQLPANPTDVEAAQGLLPCPDPAPAPPQPPAHPGTRSGNGELQCHCPLLGWESSPRTSQGHRNIEGIASGGQEAVPHDTGTPSHTGEERKA